MQKREQPCFALQLDYFTYAAAKLGSLNNSGLNGICVVLVQCARTVLAMVSLIKGHSNLVKTHCICYSSNIFSSSQQQQYCFTVAVVFWRIEVNNQGESPIQSRLLVFQVEILDYKSQKKLCTLENVSFVLIVLKKGVVRTIREQYLNISKDRALSHFAQTTHVYWR